MQSETHKKTSKADQLIKLFCLAQENINNNLDGKAIPIPLEAKKILNELEEEAIKLSSTSHKLISKAEAYEILKSKYSIKSETFDFLTDNIEYDLGLCCLPSKKRLQ